MGTSTYDKAAATVRSSPTAGGRDDRELIRLASLAASSHNTQPWLFERASGSILIRPDRSRRCPVVDPEDAHLYRSLGCAAENLIHAASLQQLQTTVWFDESLDAVVIDLEHAPEVEPTELSAALTTRQCTRTVHDGRPVPDAQTGPGSRARRASLRCCSAWR